MRTRTVTTAIVSCLMLTGVTFGAIADLAVNTSVTVTAAVGGPTTFERFNNPSTGTGIFDPFLRIQNNGTEKGYNTDGALQFDTKQGQTGGKNWTHSIKLGDLVVVNGNIELLLDINQQGGSQDGRFLSLDVMKIYLADSGSLSDYDPAAGTGLGNLIFDMGDNWVKMDNTIFNPGSGTGDMKVTISKNPAWSDGKFLYLYTEFGANFSSNDGFEEWAANVPEPATIALLGLGALTLLRKRSGK